MKREFIRTPMSFDVIPRNKRGFTLIELLVVISIIGMLASVVLASLNDARESAAVARIVQDFRQIEMALHFLADDEDISEWWHESDFGFGDENPTIAELASDTSRLGKFLSGEPSKPPGSGVYKYDNDQDIFICGDPLRNGVNLVATGVSYERALALDKIIDGDNDLACGRGRWFGSHNTFFYLIDDDYRDY